MFLPNGQELRCRRYARRQFPCGGWMYADVPETKGVEAQEYRVRPTAERAWPVEGAPYDQVPTARPSRLRGP